MQELFTAAGNRYLAAYDQLVANPQLPQHINQLCAMIDTWCLEDGFKSSRIFSVLESQYQPLANSVRHLITWYGQDVVRSSYWSSESYWSSDQLMALGVPSSICIHFVQSLTREVPPLPEAEMNQLAAAVVLFAEKSGNIGERTYAALRTCVYAQKLISSELGNHLIERANQLLRVKPFDGAVVIELERSMKIIMPRLGLTLAQDICQLLRELSSQSVPFSVLYRGNVVGWANTTIDDEILSYSIEFNGIELEIDAESEALNQLKSWSPQLAAIAFKNHLTYALPAAHP